MKMKEKTYGDYKVVILLLAFTLALSFLGVALYHDKGLIIDNIQALSTTNRSINTYFAAMVTAMVLIITLTSNLYSPYLVKLYVTHPITIVGATFMLITNFLIVISNLVSKDHPWFQTLALISFFLTITVMLGLIPFLYLISRFVRPSFFVPLMAKKIKKDLTNLSSPNRENIKEKVFECFYQIDIFINMISTGQQRRDKNLMTLVFNELFLILGLLIRQRNEKECIWRVKYSLFIPGTSEEGKFYLKKDKIWPEAYILTKLLDELEQVQNNDNEMFAFFCRKITQSNEESIALNDYQMTKFHLMILNTILNKSIERGTQKRSSLVFYYYRVNIELLSNKYTLCDESISDFMYYGHKAKEHNQHYATIFFLFDLSRIIHYISFESEEYAYNFYRKYIKSTWSAFLNQDKTLKKVTLQSIVKTFWNLYSQNYSDLTSDISRSFLSDNIEHAKILKEMIGQKSAFNREYSEHFINPEYLTGMAYSLAKDFLSDFDEILEQTHTS